MKQIKRICLLAALGGLLAGMVQTSIISNATTVNVSENAIIESDELISNSISDEIIGTETIADSIVNTSNNDGSFAWDEETGVFTIKGTGTLKSVKWPYYKDSIKIVMIDEGITEIGELALWLENAPAKESFKQLKLPDSLKIIGDHAICKWNIEALTIPKNVEEIGYQMIASCYQLQRYDVDERNTHFTSENSILYTKDLTTLVQYPMGKPNTTFQTPKHVTKIATSAFMQVDALKTLVFSPQVTRIEINAARNCANLKTIMLSAGFVGMAADMEYGMIFADLNALENIVFEEGTETIGTNVFFDCPSLKSVFLPKSLKSMNTFVYMPLENIEAIYYAGTKSEAETIGLNGSRFKISDEAFAAALKTEHQHEIIVDDGNVDIEEYAKLGVEGHIVGYCQCGLPMSKNLPAIGDVSLVKEQVEYNGKEQKPEVIIKDANGNLVSSEYYDVTFDPSYLAVGDYAVYVQFKKYYVGNYTLKYKIVPKPDNTKDDGKQALIFEDAKVTLSKTTYVYDGKFHMPKITVKDKTGVVISEKRYVIIRPKSMQAVGTYAIILKNVDDPKDTYTVSIKIIPKETKITSVIGTEKSISLKWSKKSKQTSGYEICCATNKGFTKNKKTVQIKNAKTTGVKVSKLKGKKNYYVRMRTYKNVKINGKTKKIYSKWSEIKKVKTK